MTRNMVMEFIPTQTADPTKASGRMVSNTVREFSSLLKELKDKEFGTKVRESNGWMKMKSKNKKCKYNEHNY
jgi:hypothetical protein